MVNIIGIYSNKLHITHYFFVNTHFHLSNIQFVKSPSPFESDMCPIWHGKYTIDWQPPLVPVVHAIICIQQNTSQTDCCDIRQCWRGQAIHPVCGEIWEKERNHPPPAHTHTLDHQIRIWLSGF